MDDVTWAVKLSGLEIIYDFCEAREMYDARSPIFSETFRAVDLSIPDKCTFVLKMFSIPKALLC